MAMAFSNRPRFWKRDAPRRRRTLTLPLSEPTTIPSPRQKTIEQTQSILFIKLPLEIRQLIYTYSLVYSSLRNSLKPGGDAIHLFEGYQAYQNLLPRIFQGPQKLVVFRRCSNPVGLCRAHRKTHYLTQLGSMDLLALLLTCRQM